MNEKLNNQFIGTELLDVLLSLKQNINRDLYVADLGIVEKEDTSSVTCRLPSEDVIIECVKLSSVGALSKGDKVCILFLNRSYTTNLTNLNNSLPTYVDTSKVFHNKNFGVIIGTF